MTSTFQVLHVCTGNIGRSPMAERLMRHHLQQRLGAGATAFAVHSAGTWGCQGAPMEEFAATALIERGGDPQGFRARELEVTMLADVDLVLTATREHRAQVVSLRPQVVRKAFTLKEFAGLADPVLELVEPTEPTDAYLFAQHRTETAGRLRGTGPRPDPVAVDLADPIGAPLETYRDRAAEIDLACLRAVDLLLGLSY